ncbi:serine hydrolase domain-containing protein [Marinobacter sp. CA1]|uniref:serine hydrolase domain-containing protein n=1 Tax=Marinobacter sp. CA1 TaxID=2817656 RepID=UPI001D064987|nr:serine hydrolase domain-containing protein [Marinobacter sp. CA1]UDL06759.1 beta-lactamase family protein [Marinobacter sp. CA1]
MKVALVLAGLVCLLIGGFLYLEYRALSLPELPPVVDARVSDTERLQYLDEWVDQLAEAGKFNGAILIASNGRVVFERYVGAADLTGRPITAETVFNLASVSKQFTAFAVLLLAHEGRLFPDDSLGKHIPELASVGRITLNHLLTHTSGLPDYALDKDLAERMESSGSVLTPAALIGWLQQPEQAPVFSPEAHENYSNTNYVLLAEVIARVTGQSFADFMQTRLFDPLGMERTAVVNRLRNSHRFENRAYGFRKQYFYVGKNTPYDLNAMDGTAGDGNIYATARDLVTWDASLRAGTLLPVEVYHQAYQPVRLSNGDVVTESVLGNTLQPGLGWNVQDFPVVTSYGRWQGFSNFYWRDLETGRVLVLLTNSGFFLRTALIGERLVEIVESVEGSGVITP